MLTACEPLDMTELFQVLSLHSDIEKLSRYRAVLSPDFSMYLEMAPVMQLYKPHLAHIIPIAIAHWSRLTMLMDSCK